jgi:hypothetical protein
MGQLGPATACDNNNPFDVGSEGNDDDGSNNAESPLLLSNPTDDVNDKPTGAEDNLAETTDAPKPGSGSTGAVADPPPPPAAPGTTAAVLADFALLLEKHVSTLNGCLDDIHIEVASNHGHITKRLFPVLEERIAHLETTLATTTEALESKGASLLTKCNTLKDRVSTIIDGRLNVLEPTTSSPPARSGPLEPPDDPPNDIGRAVDLAGSVHNPTDDRSVNVIETDATAAATSATTATSPTDTPIDVNACTRLAYATARAMNSQYHAPRAAPPRAPPATHRNVSPARNPYLPRDFLRQTTLPKLFFRERRPGAPEPTDATPGGPGAASGTDDIRPVLGGSIISPRH